MTPDSITFYSRHEILIDDLCREIDELKAALEESRHQEKYWRDQYNGLLDDSLNHSKQMMGNLLTFALKKAES